MEMVTIPKTEYERLKRLEEDIDEDFVDQIKKSLEDVKAGRVERLH